MKTIDALKTTLAKYTIEYARGQAVHGALAPLATIDSLLAMLALTSGASHAERDALTFALITEHQRASHPLWQSVLLVAYEPMFANIKKRLHDKRDADQRILIAFLEAVQKISLGHPPKVLALHLKHATERGVFGTQAASHEEPELLQLSAARQERSPDNPDARIEHEAAKRKIAAELDALFGGEAPRVLDVLVHARTGQESLVALLAEWHPELRARDRVALYEHYQRLRRRALVHLEARFGQELRAVSAA